MSASKLRRLQAMQRIREMLVQGYNYNSIIADTGLNERTFYRHLKPIFAQDIKNLERATNEQMIRQVVIHVKRANNIHQGLAAIAGDSTINAESRLEVYNHMFKLSNSLIETYGNAPAAAMNVKRKLSAMEKGIPESVYNSPLDASRFRPPALYDPTEQQQQQNQEQEQTEVVKATEEEQHQQRRRDWWVDPRSYGSILPYIVQSC